MTHEKFPSHTHTALMKLKQSQPPKRGSIGGLDRFFSEVKVRAPSQSAIKETFGEEFRNTNIYIYIYIAQRCKPLFLVNAAVVSAGDTLRFYCNSQLQIVYIIAPNSTMLGTVV